MTKAQDFMSKDVMQINLKQDKNNSQKVKKAKQKKQNAQFEPYWNDVWNNGYTPPTGKFKRGIFQYPLTNTELAKLVEVKKAIEAGEIGIGVVSLKKFSKAHALRLYQVLMNKRKDAYIKETIEHTPFNYKLITKLEDFNHLLMDLHSETEIALDTETTGLEFKDRI